MDSPRIMHVSLQGCTVCLQGYTVTMNKKGKRKKNELSKYSRGDLKKIKQYRFLNLVKIK